ncbi:MAG: hypothetical protein NWF06_06145 [Candidatus Bathyarchaeota archaeon]|nr:hypothetical protein [Candidatus Bathyarchaeum sp.]
MNQKINIKEIARKAYTSYHQDGILDISISSIILAFAIMMFTDMPWLGGISSVLAMSFYAGAKKTFTVPRIGYVKFPQQRVKRINIGLFVLGLLSFAVAMMAFVQTTGEGAPSWLMFLIENYMLTIGAIGTCLFLLAGYSFRTNRMYTYALLTAVLFVFGHFIYFPLQYYLTVLGITILAYGLAMLVRFIRKYPKATETADA